MPSSTSTELGAGIMAGVMSQAPYHPIDTIKSRAQTQVGTKSPVSIFYSMVRNEGLLSLYRGAASPMAGYGLINGSVFYSRAVTRKALGGDYRPLTVLDEIIVGASAGFWSSFVRCPVERVKSVMQVRTRDVIRAPYSSSLACAVGLTKKHGVSNGLYAGLGSTIAREVPQYIFYFLAYENTKAFLLENDLASEAFAPAVAGGAAGAAVWVPPFYSIDVIKTRLQTAPSGTYTGIVDCALKSYRESGPMVFVRGVELALARGVLVHGTIFFLYESCLKIVKRLEGSVIQERLKAASPRR